MLVFFIYFNICVKSITTALLLQRLSHSTLLSRRSQTQFVVFVFLSTHFDFGRRCRFFFSRFHGGSFYRSSKMKMHFLEMRNLYRKFSKTLGNVWTTATATISLQRPGKPYRVQLNEFVSILKRKRVAMKKKLKMQPLNSYALSLNVLIEHRRLAINIANVATCNVIVKIRNKVCLIFFLRFGSHSCSYLFIL